jgi:chromosome transmission fidelity protein 1
MSTGVPAFQPYVIACAWLFVLHAGINFADALGRCVVMLGMPYANPSDLELQTRMAHMDGIAQTSGRSGSSPHACKGVASSFGGQQLYEAMCMNAVNQAIGRCIRHKSDYAAVSGR